MSFRYEFKCAARVYCDKCAVKNEVDMIHRTATSGFSKFLGNSIYKKTEQYKKPFTSSKTRGPHLYVLLKLPNTMENGSKGQC